MITWLFINLLWIGPIQSEGHRVTYLTEEHSVVTGQQRIDIQFKIEEGYHIQSDDPSNENLIPTELKISGAQNARVVGVIFPDHHLLTLQGSEEDLEVFDGIITLTLVIEYYSDEAINLPAELCYQACDDRKCYFPRCLAFDLQLRPKVRK